MAAKNFLIPFCGIFFVIIVATQFLGLNIGWLISPEPMLIIAISLGYLGIYIYLTNIDQSSKLIHYVSIVVGPLFVTSLGALVVSKSYIFLIEGNALQSNLYEYLYFSIILITATFLGLILLRLTQHSINTRDTAAVEAKIEKDSPWYKNWPFVLILTSWVGMRIWKIATVPFWYDELLHVAAAPSLSSHWIPVYPSGLEYSRSFIITHLVHFISFFGPISESTARMSIVLLSVLLLACIYFLVKKITKSNALALTACALIATDPTSIIISQEVRYYVLLSVISILFIAATLCKKDSLTKIFLLGFLIWLGLNSSMLFLPFSSIILLSNYGGPIYNKIKNRSLNKKTWLWLVSLGAIPLALATTALHTIMTNGYFSGPSIIRLTSSYITFLDPLLLLLFILFIPITVLAKNRSWAVLLIPSLALIAFLSFLDTRFGDATRYMTFILPILIICEVLALSFLQKMFSKKLWILLVAIILSNTIVNLVNYSIKDNELLLKQQATWARPDYSYWSRIVIPSNALVISDVPHIAEYYVGKVNYYLGPSLAQDMEISKTENIESLDRINQCSYIFADYKTSYLWGKDIVEFLKGQYSLVGTSRQTAVYKSNLCI